MSRISPDKLNVDDVFYECQAGMNIELRVIESPTKTVSESTDQVQWRWRAVNTQNAQVIDYLLTEGLEHYGPKLYTFPQYAQLKDGELTFPLFGA